MPFAPTAELVSTPLSSPRTQLVGGVIARASAMSTVDAGVGWANQSAVDAVLCRHVSSSSTLRVGGSVDVITVSVTFADTGAGLGVWPSGRLRSQSTCTS